MCSRNKGFSLIEMLVVVLIILSLAAIAGISIVKAAEAGLQNRAASHLAEINAAEFEYSNYGAYVPLANLMGVIGQNISCLNPNLLSGQIANQDPEGYKSHITFIGAANFSCAGGPQGYSGYTITMEPLMPQQRHFFTCVGAGCTSQADSALIKFAQGRTALESDPVFNITATSSVGSGTGTGNSLGGSGQGIVTIWNSSTNYPVGSEVLRNASENGDSCTQVGGIAGQAVGIFVNLNGQQSDPCNPPNSPNWFLTGGQANWHAAPSPGLNGSCGLTVPPGTGAIATCGASNPINFTSSFSKWGVTVSPATPPGNIINVGFMKNGTVQIFCVLVVDNQSGLGCSYDSSNGVGEAWGNFVNLSGGSSGNPITVNPGDNLELILMNSNSATISYSSISWQLSP